MTARQDAWQKESDKAAREGNDLAAGLFALIAQPNESEQAHNCVEHSQGFNRDDRRGFKCGICGKVVKWVDPE